MTSTTQAPTEIVAGTWTIDPSHSEVGFTVRHLMTKVRGQFEKFEGSIVTGDAPFAAATIDLTSINTREPNRDAHLRSKDFFDVEAYGPMTFVNSAAPANAMTPNSNKERSFTAPLPNPT